MADLKKLVRRECSTILGVHLRSIGNFLKEEIPLPTNKDGRTFSAVQVVKWWLARHLERVASPAAESPEAVRWLERYRRERFRLSRIERRLREGEVIAWADVEKEWCGRVRVVTEGLEFFADRLPPLLVGNNRDEIRAILKSEVRLLRAAYARDGKYTPEVIDASKTES
jgi:hypothetical protein